MNKTFPINYPPEIVDVIEKASFSKGEDVLVVGSASIRTMRYSADVDCYERANIPGNSRADALMNASKLFRQNIQRLLSTPLTYIVDFKAGSIEEWVVIHPQAHIQGKKVLGYSAEESRAKVKQLYEDKVITKDEYDSALELLVLKPTPEQFFAIKDALRFNIIRWTLDEIKKGFKVYRGRKVTLADIFGQPAIAKLDIITLVDNNRFIEISIIYELSHNKERLNDFGNPDLSQMLRESVLEYWKSNKVFKMSKRIYSLSMYLKKNKTVKTLTPYLNSDLGLLYTITSDLDTLVLLVEHTKHLPKKRIQFELEHIPSRLGNISQLKDLLSKEEEIFNKLKSIERHPSNVNAIDTLNDELKGILNKYAIQELTKLKLYPPPAFALP